jgi:hypothetical protein
VRVRVLVGGAQALIARPRHRQLDVPLVRRDRPVEPGLLPLGSFSAPARRIVEMP